MKDERVARGRAALPAVVGETSIISPEPRRENWPRAAASADRNVASATIPVRIGRVATRD
jgi:hypothetical protein